MTRRIMPILLCLIIFACCTTAHAVEARAAGGNATLNFEDGSAICTFNIYSPGISINVKLELLRGSVLIDSWSKSGTHTVSLNESCCVTPGFTYTLKVSGTCGSDTISPTTITKTCPRN